MLYAFYIFNRSGKLLYCYHWSTSVKILGKHTKSSLFIGSEHGLMIQQPSSKDKLLSPSTIENSVSLSTSAITSGKHIKEKLVLKDDEFAFKTPTNRIGTESIPVQEIDTNHHQMIRISSHHPYGTCQMQNNSLVAEPNVMNIKSSYSVNHYETSIEEHIKLVYGVVFSLKAFVQKITRSISPQHESLVSFRTTHYKLHHFESLTGIKLILMTDPTAGNLKSVLKYIYSNIYVEFVVKNPLIQKDECINCDTFQSALLSYLHSLPVHNR